MTSHVWGIGQYPPPPFFADDLVHMSCSQQGLQQQMEYLSAYALANGMRVNASKTKAMVFHRGARAPKL